MKAPQEIRGVIDAVKAGRHPAKGDPAIPRAAKWSAEHGYTKLLALLLPHLPEDRERNAIMLAAIEHGKVSAVRLLVPACRPKSNNSIMLATAVRTGNAKIVALLIPVSEPKALSSRALVMAAKDGNLEIVKMLIPVSDPSTFSALPLRAAAEEGHLDVIRALITVSGDLAELLKEHGGTFTPDAFSIISAQLDDIELRKLPEAPSQTQKPTPPRV